MAISNFRAELSAAIKDVWAVVTSFDSYWRSGLREIVKNDDTHFTEIAKNGFETRFTITAFVPNSLYEMDIENENMTGIGSEHFPLKIKRPSLTSPKTFRLKKCL